MELKIVEFETAKLLKEVGFDWDSSYYYDNEEDSNLIEFNYFHCDRNYKDYSGYPKDVLYYAPTQALVQMWFREKHNIIIDISKVDGVTDDWHYGINLEWSYFRGTYEQALEAGILECIKLLKNKQ